MSDKQLQVQLLRPSTDAWLQCVLDNFNEFLIDHAANERKASSLALSLVAHYPDRTDLVMEMIDLSLEELNHFRQVMRILQAKNLVMPPDEKDPYVNQLRSHVRKGAEHYFLDRLLSAAVIEARGEERFRRIAESLAGEELQTFYTTIANSERGHHILFLQLAERYFSQGIVKARLEDWLVIEDAVVEALPLRARLH